MSRRSTCSVRNQSHQNHWVACQKCQVFLPNDNQSCDSPSTASKCQHNSFIRNDCLFATSIKSSEADGVSCKEFSPAEKRNFVFVSESAMRLCKFVIGDWIVLSSSLYPDKVSIAKQIWPVSDRSLATVYLSDTDSLNIALPNEQVVLKKLSADPPIALDISLKYQPDGFNVSELNCKELEIFVRNTMLDNLYTIGNSLEAQFFNKVIKFTVTTITELPGTELSKAMSRLALAEGSAAAIRFFRIKKSTKIHIHREGKSPQLHTDSNGSTKMPTVPGGLEVIVKTLADSMRIAFDQGKSLNCGLLSRGAIVHGTPGCGKSLLCNYFRKFYAPNVLSVNGSEIISKFYGETEAKLKGIFAKASENYPRCTLIIFDDINSICNDNDKTDVIRRFISQLGSMLDALQSKKEFSLVYFLATTNDLASVSASIRRSGRLDTEIEIPVPDAGARLKIIESILAENRAEHVLEAADIDSIAKSTHGFVGGDLVSMITKAGFFAAQQSSQKITMADIENALGQVRPSAMREVVIESPNVRWADIGGQKDLKLKLQQAIEWPLNRAESFVRLGISPPRGLLMFGPPGCSKTMIAKALATESNVNFLSIKGPELFSMWVGESERAVRQLFVKARQVAPVIIFFDEFDALVGERSSESGASVKERVLAQILTEMDGVNALVNVTVVAATNRPDLIDSALMRPGRIDRLVYVRLPDHETRAEIFRIKLAKMPVADDIQIEWLARITDGYSGAEIISVCHESAIKALEECATASVIRLDHFQMALDYVKPRTSPTLLKLYEDFINKM